MSHDDLPPPSAPRPEPFALTDPRQRRIYDLLHRLVGEGASALFFDTCLLFSGSQNFRAPAHIAGHLMRELESALRDAMWFFTALPRPPRDSKSGAHAQSIKAVVDAVFEPEDRPHIAEMWVRAFTEESQLHSIAHRDALRAPRSFESARIAWVNMVLLLDTVLPKYEAAYRKAIDQVDGLLAKATPNGTDVERVMTHLPPSSAAYARFFHELRSAGWFRPLRDAGAFETPPGLVRVPDSDQLGSARWPPANYLRAIASDRTVQAEIAAVVEAWPPVTNVYVAWAVLDIAAALDPPLAARLAPRCAQVISAGIVGHLEDLIQRLILNLTDGGEVEAALVLLGAVVTTREVPRTAGTGDGSASS